MRSLIRNQSTAFGRGNASETSLLRMFSTVNGEKLFDKILIANRGEIACRVIKTARKLGIKTVSVFSEPDRNSMHVRMADEAFCIGPAASSQSYLSIPKIMEVIKQTGAQAVHPGYGFLSENAKFADALEKNGIAFMGPRSHSIRAMGDKIESKELAKKARVNTIPGNMNIMESEDMCVKVANEVGYPVMVKASAGGGGKGMRIAYNDKQARQGYRMSKDEAMKSFGDDRLFVEKYIEEPRHIEIQLIADSFGNVCALPERECSIQRRNQKVLEEAPSTLLDPQTRHAMQEQAIMLAKAVQYQSAGTVEFLCDKKKNFYFLEMNTRLQVEHPVSELITGVDLVEQMIRVAAGYKLPDAFLSGHLPFKGWAHEARVYAEDPVRGFLPSTGRLLNYKEPTHVEGIRCDSGITQGSEISMFYDPMISKLCSYAEDRTTALNRLERALDAYVVTGLGHNIQFLRDVCRNERFRSGKITTKFIPEEYPEGFVGVVLSDDEKFQLAAIAEKIASQYLGSVAKLSGQLSPPKPHAGLIIEFGKNFYKIVEGGKVAKIDADGNEIQSASFKVNNFSWETSEVLSEVTLNAGPQTDYVVQVMDKSSIGMTLKFCGAIVDVKMYEPQEFKYRKHMVEKIKADFSKFVLSPMPGLIVSIAVKEGQEVFLGQELCVVEAMKMQNILSAEKNGKIKKITKKGGDSVQVDEIIIEFE